MCFKKGVKWWFFTIIASILIILAILCILFFSPIVKYLIELELRFLYEETPEWWTKSLNRYVKIYVFNVTNPIDATNNKTKITLNELGPFVYEETWENINVVKNTNETISFTPNIFRNFRRDLSNSSDEDRVIVPNIYRQIDEDIFETVSIKQLLWSVDNPKTEIIEKSGILSYRDDAAKDRMTVFVGKSDSNKKGIINRINGETHSSTNLMEQCNRLNGSFGLVFPKKLSKEGNINLYSNDLKRLIPFYYKKDVTSPNDIHGYRYVMPEYFFDDPKYSDENECFCPVGMNNCADSKNAAIFLTNHNSSNIIYSLPHFYLADKSIRNSFKGISTPEKKLHRMYVDIHPYTGITLRYRAGIQINTMIIRNESSLIFPIIWFEDNFENTMDQILHLTKIPGDVLFGIIVAFFIVGILTIALSLYCLVRGFKKQKTLQIQINMNKDNCNDKSNSRTNIRKVHK